MTRRFSFLALVASLALSSAAAPSCAKKDDVIVRTGEGKELTSAAIDADPIALLPSNPIGALSLDAQQLFASQFGQRLLALTQARSPLPASAEFQPARDLTRAYVGFYSMQGADVAGVAVGRFQPAKIEQAAEQNPRTASGLTVTKTRYAGRNLYTAGGLGFATLTERTLLFGNETGLRRALDRIQEGRARRRLPKWMEKQLSEPSAPIVGGADFTSQPLSSAVRQQLGFMDGLRTLALVGNFQEPGLNLAGTLAYDDAEAAQRGTQNLKRLHAQLSSATLLMSLVGIPQPLRKLDAQAADKESRFVLGVDAGGVAALLDKAQAYLAPAMAPRP